MNKIHIIGAGIAGQEGFSQRAIELIHKAQLLIGGASQLALFPEFAGETLVIDDTPMADILHRLRSTKVPTVLLASGDPLFFGIGRDLKRNLPDIPMEFVPNVCSVQYAFSKIGEPWDDAVFISAAGRGLTDAVDRVVANDKAVVLTDATHSPADIARELLERGRDGYTAFLCESLGFADERIQKVSLQQLLTLEMAPLNLLILIKQYESGQTEMRPTFGIPDKQFAAVKHTITHEEVRVINLAKLRLRHDHCLWDIGAGSGSICIEADHLLPNGRILAVERNAQALDFLKQNLNTFNTRRVTVVEDEAPACLGDLPDPDRVFIGGSGGNLWEILERIDERLPDDGRVVLNATTLDTLRSASEWFENAGYSLEVVTVNIARTNPESDYQMFEALAPVYVLTAAKH